MTGKPDPALTSRPVQAPRLRDDLGSPTDPLLPPHAAAARSRLAVLLSLDEPLPLLEAMLLVAAEEHQDVDVLTQIGRVMTMASEAKERVAAVSNPFARIEALRALIFDEIGFKGNVDHYDDPRNSFLDEVLDRKLGIPLTLSVITIEIARAAGLTAHGIGLPGHFIVRIDEQDRSLYIDPFHGGHVITLEDCRDLVVRTTGRASLFRRDSLDVASPRAMLNRLLMNLKRIHLAQGDYNRALSIVERLLIVSPGDAKEIRDRGLLLAHLGRPDAAICDLESYLALVPEAPDADSVRGRLAWILRKMGESR